MGVPIGDHAKENGDVRICVDMQMANRAINHYTNLRWSLNCVYKLDLMAGYHQLTLAPESCYITTFATHEGLRRYTRLNFSTNSASEIFQMVINDLIRDIPGALNISDVIVFSKTQEEHNAALKAKVLRGQPDLKEEKVRVQQKEYHVFRVCVLRAKDFPWSQESGGHQKYQTADND